jgi:hypothetical protein
MSSLAKQSASTVIPALRYRNTPTAIEWLCKAFGFKKQAVYPNPDGTTAHAQLTLGTGMVMLGSVTNGSPYGNLIKQPDEIGRLETQPPYLTSPNTTHIPNGQSRWG